MFSLAKSNIAKFCQKKEAKYYDYTIHALNFKLAEVQALTAHFTKLLINGF